MTTFASHLKATLFPLQERKPLREPSSFANSFRAGQRRLHIILDPPVGADRDAAVIVHILESHGLFDHLGGASRLRY